jgi:molecular chaperone DnaJ
VLRKDYYQILGLDKTATAPEIKKAYRKLARKYHPDVSGDNPQFRQRFNDVTEAYDVLSDPERRKIYDGGGVEQAWFNESNFGNIKDIFEKTYRQQQEQAQSEAASDRPKPPPKASSGKPSDKSRFNFGDIFNHIVDSVQTRLDPDEKDPDNAKKKPKEAKPASLDIEQALEITLEEAWKGTRKTVSIKREKPCVLCGGVGQVSGQTCRNCFGKGIVQSARKIEVAIPSGVRTGSKVRVSGEGNSQGDHSGSLLLRIELAPHAFFRVEENGDLYCDIPVSAPEAALGSAFSVPTLEGWVKMRIPAGTHTLELPISERLPAGTYFLELRQGTEVDQTQLIKH